MTNKNVPTHCLLSPGDPNQPPTSGITGVSEYDTGFKKNVIRTARTDVEGQACDMVKLAKWLRPVMRYVIWFSQIRMILHRSLCTLPGPQGNIREHPGKFVVSRDGAEPLSLDMKNAWVWYEQVTWPLWNPPPDRSSLHNVIQMIKDSWGRRSKSDREHSWWAQHNIWSCQINCPSIFKNDSHFNENILSLKDI